MSVWSLPHLYLRIGEKGTWKRCRYHLIEILMGLNNEFDNVCSTILSNDPLPPVNKAYYLVHQVEN